MGVLRRRVPDEQTSQQAPAASTAADPTPEALEAPEPPAHMAQVQTVAHLHKITTCPQQTSVCPNCGNECLAATGMKRERLLTCGACGWRGREQA